MKDKLTLSVTETVEQKEQKRLLTVNDLCDALQVSRPVAYRLLKREDFPAFRLEGRWKVPSDGLNRWIAAQAGEAVG